MTRRIVTAMRHPRFKIWGHALGRYVLRRPPFACHMEEILDARGGDRAPPIEVNGDPHRLDMEPRWIREARTRGITFVVSTDAHSVAALGNLRWGVDMARRGWLTPGRRAEHARRRRVPGGGAAVTRLFILSPASCARPARAPACSTSAPTFDVARRLRAPEGLPAGRGLRVPERPLLPGQADVRARVRPLHRPGCPGSSSSRPAMGFDRPRSRSTSRACAAVRAVPIERGEPRYREPLVRDAEALAEAIDADCEVVLLGSVASGKYVDLLADVLGERLRFPAEFVGRGRHEPRRTPAALRGRPSASCSTCPWPARPPRPRPPRLVPRPASERAECRRPAASVEERE